MMNEQAPDVRDLVPYRFRRLTVKQSKRILYHDLTFLSMNVNRQLRRPNT